MMGVYRCKLPTDAEARRILGIREVPEYTPSNECYGHVFLHGDYGPACVECQDVSEALCDFPLGEQGRTCDRALCFACAPTLPGDHNYCREHAARGPGMLLFTPAAVAPAPAQQKPTRARPLPKAPPEHERWRAIRRSGLGYAIMTAWTTEFEAHAEAKRCLGEVETWGEFVKAWRIAYPLKNPRRKK